MRCGSRCCKGPFHDQLLIVAGHRGGPEERARQVHRECSFPCAGRAGVPPAGEGVQALRSRHRGDGRRGRDADLGLPREGGRLPARVQAAPREARLPRRGHHLRLQRHGRRLAGRHAQRRRRLHRGRSRGEAHVPRRVPHGRRGQRLPGVPRRQAAQRGHAQHAPVPRNPEGAQLCPRGARRAAALRRPRDADQRALRRGGPEHLRGRGPRGPAAELRRLPHRRRRGGRDVHGPRGAGAAAAAGAGPHAHEGDSVVLPAVGDAGAGHRSGGRQHLPDVWQ
mmetsp:Transcript_44561/g.115288  ORF Transcript_44561/g.115288 Transcript_44561/m.115288 type:complete len:280 (+) Transcript_44561:3027-3866(+)